MICLELKLNGNAAIVAGAPDAKVIAANVAIYPEVQETILKVSGQVEPAGQPAAEAHWFAGNLAVGDVVTIRVIESAAAHPARLSRDDPSVVATDQIPVSCSFCGKPQSAADHLIAGKRAMICHECVEFMHETEVLDRKQEQMLDPTDDA
jgi:hypothetical protein